MPLGRQSAFRRPRPKLCQAHQAEQGCNEPSDEHGRRHRMQRAEVLSQRVRFVGQMVRTVFCGQLFFDRMDAILLKYLACLLKPSFFIKTSTTFRTGSAET